MIYEVSGDILLTKAQMIAHGIASNDPMTQGLALSLHKNYPAMHKDECRDDGTPQIVRINAG